MPAEMVEVAVEAEKGPIEKQHHLPVLADQGLTERQQQEGIYGVNIPAAPYLVAVQSHTQGGSTVHTSPQDSLYSQCFELFPSYMLGRSIESA